MGVNVEMEGLYYGRGTNGKEGFRIDLYSFQQWGFGSGRSHGSSSSYDSSSDAFWRCYLSQEEAVL